MTSRNRKAAFRRKAENARPALAHLQSLSVDPMPTLIIALETSTP